MACSVFVISTPDVPPYEDAAQPFDEKVGVMHVLVGSTEGITGVGAQFWHLGVPGMPGDPELFDYLGLAIG